MQVVATFSLGRAPCCRRPRPRAASPPGAAGPEGPGPSERTKDWARESTEHFARHAPESESAAASFNFTSHQFECLAGRGEAPPCPAGSVGVSPARRRNAPARSLGEPKVSRGARKTSGALACHSARSISRAMLIFDQLPGPGWRRRHMTKAASPAPKVAAPTEGVTAGGGDLIGATRPKAT